MTEPALARPALRTLPARRAASSGWIRIFGALGVAATLSLGAPAIADKPPADPAKKEQVKKLFEEGMIQYDLGKYEAAIGKFEKAYEVIPDPAFLFNIAQAHRMAGHVADALRTYKTFLRKVPNAANKKEVTAFIATLEKPPETGQTPAQTAQPAQPKPLLLPPPPPIPYVEPKSKHAYMTRVKIDGKDYSLTGVSRRTYIGFLLYAVGLYVEEEPARKAFPKLVEKAGGSDPAQLKSRDLAQNFIVLGEFGKAAVLYFTRDIAANKIRDSYRDMLKDNLKADTPPTLKQNTEKFLNLFTRDVKNGEEMTIATTPDGRISVTFGTDKREGPLDPTLCIDLWTLWIGQKAINPEMKQGLVERIQDLGATTAGAAGSK